MLHLKGERQSGLSSKTELERGPPMPHLLPFHLALKEIRRQREVTPTGPCRGVSA